MHQRRRPRRRDRMSSAPVEGSFRIRNQQDVSRDAFDYTCKIDFSAHERLFVPKISEGLSKKATLTKESTDEEVPKRREMKHGSPNLISRLMGLDMLPSSPRQHKNEDYCSPGRRNTRKDQEFIDVFGVAELAMKKKHRRYSDSKGMCNCRGSDTDMDSGRPTPIFSDAKGVPACDLLKNPHDSKDASEVLDSGSDIFLELLQDPKSLFANHLRHLNRGLCSPKRSESSTLRPFKGTKIWDSDAQSKKSSRSERTHRHFHMLHEVTCSDFKTHAERLNKNYAAGNSVFFSNSLPAHIVILKPNIEKAQKLADAKSTTPDNFRVCPRRCRKIVASVMEELHNDGTTKTKLKQREIRGKLRQATTGQTKKNFTSEMNPYDGIIDPFSLPGINKPNHSKAIYQSCGHFREWGDSFRSPSLYSSKSSVSREARNRLFERWKIGRQSQGMGLLPLCSSTLRDALEIYDRETPEDIVDFFNTRCVSDDKFSREEVTGSKGHPLGISHKNDFKDDHSRSPSRLKSQIETSFVLELSDRKQGFEDAQYVRPSISSDVKFSKPGTTLFKSSEQPTSKPGRSHSVGDENMLSAWKTHVNSERSSSIIRSRHYLDNLSLDSVHNYALRDRNQLTNNMPISIVNDDSWHLTTQEEQDISSDHPQDELLPSESDVAESHPHMSEETEQPSPISVLESPSDDETYISGCFERLSVDLKELRLQLHLLKLESVDKCLEEDVLVPGDADYEGESDVVMDPGKAQQFRDDDRDFTYLLDILIESGIRDVDKNKLSDHIDQNVFYKLEKKYHKLTTWPSSERKLLFDLINHIVAGIATRYMNLHQSLLSKIHPSALDHEGLVETLWQILVKKRKELYCNSENKILKPTWFDSENDVDLIGIEIEIMLIDDLLEELVGELV